MEARTIAPLALFDEVEGTHVGKGIASLYRPWKKSATVPYARYPGNWRVPPTPDDLVCAHRTIPFWTVLRLRHGERVAYCVVLDRGPYGFCERKRPTDEELTDRRVGKRCPKGYRYRVIVKRWKRKRTRGWYRGLIDATPAVHRMMGSDGWTVVRVERLDKLGRQKRVLRQRRLSTRSNPSLAYVRTQ